MKETPARVLGTRNSERGLYIVLVVVSYVITFAVPMDSATPLRMTLLIAAGVFYTLIGLFVQPRIQGTSRSLDKVAYLVVQLALGGAIIYLSEARGWLMVLPLIAHCVEEFPRGWAVAGTLLVALVSLISVTIVLTSAIGLDGQPLFPLFSDPFWEQMVPVALPYLLAFAFVFLYSLAAVREREARTEVERLAAELRAANQRLREYAAQAEELATAQERNRLAREIHDGLGHYMTGIHMQIQAGRAVLDLDREAALDALDKAQALAQEGLTEVRRSVSALRASPLDAQSLPQAIEALANECRTAGIKTRFTVRGEACDLSPQAEMALYRVAQEGLTNVRRHAQAAHAEVTLDYRDAGQVQLAVRDDGVGAEAPGGGYGLVGVRERVHLLGGQIEVETKPGEGFCLRVRVPTGS